MTDDRSQIEIRRLTPNALANHFALALRQAYAYKSLDAIRSHIVAIQEANEAMVEDLTTHAFAHGRWRAIAGALIRIGGEVCDAHRGIELAASRNPGFSAEAHLANKRLEATVDRLGDAISKTKKDQGT